LRRARVLPRQNGVEKRQLVLAIDKRCHERAPK
jgi:hypothetical protein